MIANHTIKKTILVLGPNSYIYSLLKDYDFWNNYELSFMSLSNVPDLNNTTIECDYVVYFGYHSSCEVELSTVAKVIDHVYFKKFVHLSSIVCTLSSRFDFFRYVRNKRSVEDYLQSRLANTVVSLRLSRLVTTAEAPVGLCSYVSDLASAVEEALISPKVGIYVPKITCAKPDFQNNFYDLVIASRFGRFIRPVDIVFRISGFKCYGYSRLVHLLYNKNQLILPPEKML